MPPIGDKLREAIERSGRSRYRIAKETGVSQATLSRFMHGASMGTDNADRVADLLDLDLVGPPLGTEARERDADAPDNSPERTTP